MSAIVLNNPLIQHKLAIIRDKKTGTKEFREIIGELATFLCYEAMSDAKLEEVPGIKDGKKLVVKGKNVMLGYIKSDKPGVIQPLQDGWYDTGDIVDFDKDRFITIKGRAKRFAKIAGEMVSLTAVEETLSSIWKDFQHAVVAIADEQKGEQLVLFTTRQNTTASEISTNFKKLGFSDLFVPRKIKILDEMLLMGNGKTDYVTLKDIAEKNFI